MSHLGKSWHGTETNGNDLNSEQLRHAVVHSKLFLYSYPCVLLCTSAAEKNQSDRCQCSTFQRSGSASWRCARKSSFSRPYGVCFSSPPPHLPSFIPTSRAATWQIFKYIFLHKKQEKSKDNRTFCSQRGGILLCIPTFKSRWKNYLKLIHIWWKLDIYGIIYFIK